MCTDALQEVQTDRQTNALDGPSTADAAENNDSKINTTCILHVSVQVKKLEKIQTVRLNVIIYIQ